MPIIKYSSYFIYRHRLKGAPNFAFTTAATSIMPYAISTPCQIDMPIIKYCPDPIWSSRLFLHLDLPPRLPDVRYITSTAKYIIPYPICSPCLIDHLIAPQVFYAVSTKRRGFFVPEIRWVLSMVDGYPPLSSLHLRHYSLTPALSPAKLDWFYWTTHPTPPRFI